jgi:hypothetical protein
MADNYLRLRFSDDGDGTGELLARAEADGFAGESGAYFNPAEIEAFAKAIGTFPLPVDDKRLSITGGFWSRERRGDLEQELLGISVYFADAPRGYIGIQIRMATPIWKGTRPDSKKSAAVEVVTTYEPLAKFSRDLDAVLRGKLKEAVLKGQSLL